MKAMLIFCVIFSILIEKGTSIRLVGGQSGREGRVEVFHNNQWGTICDDGWDDNDAAVVCRMLGFSGTAVAIGGARYGQGAGQIWLDNVACTGSEANIEQCLRGGWGTYNCHHSEDASVQCSYSGLQCYQCSSCSEPTNLQTCTSSATHCTKRTSSGKVFRSCAQAPFQEGFIQTVNGEEVIEICYCTGDGCNKSATPQVALLLLLAMNLLLIYRGM